VKYAKDMLLYKYANGSNNGVIKLSTQLEIEKINEKFHHLFSLQGKVTVIKTRMTSGACLAHMEE
jgi:hypothetical protein